MGRYGGWSPIPKHAILSLTPDIQATQTTSKHEMLQPTPTPLFLIIVTLLEIKSHLVSYF